MRTLQRSSLVVGLLLLVFHLGQSAVKSEQTVVQHACEQWTCTGLLGMVSMP